MAPLVEICVDNFQSIQNAFDCGVKRIELCSSLMNDGLTPSLGLFKFIKGQFPQLTIFPMIRPRGGDFLYSPEELFIMGEDINQFKNRGADGFVFGCLKKDGSIDIDANKFLLEQANPLPCTFHRAFDVSKNMENSLNTIIDLGFKRLLTSGSCKTALDGISNIKKLIDFSEGKIVIMPGAGINPENLETILKETQVEEYHCSASIEHHSLMEFPIDSKILSNHTWKVSDPETIKKLIEISNKF